MHSFQQGGSMPYISSDKNIRDFVQNILRSGQWEIVRHGKHVIIRHIAKGAKKTIVVPSTPSDPRTFANFRRDYFRYLRQHLIQTGWIQNNSIPEIDSPLAA
jgi:hypothetical protein